MSIARAQILGRFTKSPELRFTPKGDAVLNFDLAVNHRWTSDSGEKKEEVSFFTCVCFRGAAETIAKFFNKGRMIYVDGRLTEDVWLDRASGEKRRKVKMIVENFSFTGDNTGVSTAPDAAGGAAPVPRTIRQQTQEAGGPPREEDDVPF